MAVEFKLPPLGEDVDEGEIVSILVSEGDTIEEDQNVVEIETDKATLEVPCSRSGKIAKIHVSEGDRISVGDPLLSVGEEGEEPRKNDDQGANAEDESASKGDEAGKDRGGKEARDTKKSSGTDDEAREERDEDTEQPKRKKKKAEETRGKTTDDSDEQAEDQEQDKEAAEREEAGEEEAAAEGEEEDKGKGAERKKRSKGTKVKAEADDRTKTDAPDENEDAKTRDKKAEGDASAKTGTQEPIPAPPSTRRLARELGVDLAAVAKEYPGERISSGHVKAYVRHRLEGDGATPAPADRKRGAAATTPELPDFEKWGPIDRVPRTPLQRRSAERLEAAWVAPHVTHHDEADIGRLESMRRHYNATIEDGAKLTVTAFLVKAAVQALREFPKFNASLDTQADELILKHYYHIGVAVSTDRGLIVPAIRDCDDKSIVDIAAELEDVADRTRNRKVKLEELRGATFTITNVGGIGGTGFAPILSYPEVAILGAARARHEAIVRDGEVENRLVLPLCLSFDHRAIDGADAAYFMREIVEFLEHPDVSLMRL